ncbi:hypothetical protein LIER_01261 [Lithospermum erythrorhizon]|uniref:Uncharacterized protein n=1 Tax=Lithospermum erythrorhizon TaxID=34254 RepID=A0AAV3NKC2_LITER
MSGIDTLVTLIKLHVDSMYVPIKQKRRTFNDEKNQVVREEDEFLLKVDSIRELQFLEWIAKVVYVKNSNVKKSNGTWRICGPSKEFERNLQSTEGEQAKNQPRQVLIWANVGEVYGD